MQTPTLTHLFRHESGKLVAVLTRIFGTHNIALAEDIVQDTLLKALEVWKIKGVPDNPAAWLMRVAKNQALDTIRKEKVRTKFARDITALLQSEYTLHHTLDQLTQEREIADDQLRMMFACCDDALPAEAQIALILKTLCGFSIAEIAKAFLSNEETISKRLYRAKQSFRAQKIGFVIPQGEQLHTRLAQVLTAIYLIFNEGYNTTHHPSLIRDDLVEEALRLAWLLAQHSQTAQPEVWALLALMCFHAARLEGRVDAAGELLTLSQQDRSLWDKALIAKGIELLDHAIQTPSLSAYHLEASIAKMHCLAPDYAHTDWATIRQLYQLLYQHTANPLVLLNSAIALAEWQGAAAGIAELSALPPDSPVRQYYLYHASLADWYARTASPALAEAHYRQALSLTQSPTEVRFLEKRLQVLCVTTPLR